MSKKKRLVLAACVAAVISLIAVIICLSGGKGNSEEYSAESVSETTQSSITNETIIFLGSDFTIGTKAKNDSFVEFLKKTDGVNAVMFAEENTPLAARGSSTSLVSLLAEIPTRNAMPALLACELPYADVNKQNKLGEIAEGYNINELDTTTIIGAMEYVVGYSRQTWGCPVMLYTCPYINDDDYKEIVDAMYAVADKWNSEVIDFYNNEEFKFEKEDKRLYMMDNRNPSRAGYKEKFTPEFRTHLTKFLRPTI